MQSLAPLLWNKTDYRQTHLAIFNSHLSPLLHCTVGGEIIKHLIYRATATVDWSSLSLLSTSLPAGKAETEKEGVGGSQSDHPAQENSLEISRNHEQIIRVTH